MQLPDDRPSSLDDVKKQFVHLSKTMHPDVCSSPHATEDYAEVQDAYKILADMLKDSRKHQNDYAAKVWHTTDPKKDGGQEDMQKEFIKEKMDLRTEEEYLYYMIFGKKYLSDPEAYFQPENTHKRHIYEENVHKIAEQNNRDKSAFAGTGEARHSETEGSGYTGPLTRPSKAGSSIGPVIFLTLGIGALAYGMYSMHSHKEKPSDKSTISDKDSKHQPQQQPQTTLNPLPEPQETPSETPNLTRRQPSAIDDSDRTLLDSTIWQDIETFASVTSVIAPIIESPLQTTAAELNDLPAIDDHILARYTAIALEAERSLNKIFVNMYGIVYGRDHVKREIEHEGYYDPPGVFFRLNGPIYFKIRKNM